MAHTFLWDFRKKADYGHFLPLMLALDSSLCALGDSKKYVLSLQLKYVFWVLEPGLCPLRTIPNALWSLLIMSIEGENEQTLKCKDATIRYVL